MRVPPTGSDRYVTETCDAKGLRTYDLRLRTFLRRPFPAWLPAPRRQQLLVNDPFNLSVYTAEFIGRPFLEQTIGFFINAQYKTFFIRHAALFRI